jgi:hypothetical protein
MPDFVRSLGSFALGVLICAAGFDARAQDAARMTVAGTTISLGGGVQLLQLPDIRYTFLAPPATAGPSTNSETTISTTMAGPLTPRSGASSASGLGRR